MFFKNSNSIKSVRIINHDFGTTERFPPESNYTIDNVELEIIYQNNSKDEKFYTRKSAMCIIGAKASISFIVRYVIFN